MMHNHRTLGLPLAQLATRMLLPGLVPFAIGALLYLGWCQLAPPVLGRWPTLALLLPACALHLLLCALALWCLLDYDERSKLIKVAAPILSRLGRLGARWSLR
jgi:hypothetical protein